MKANLITLCGCSREFDITYPPPPQIDIPLNRNESNRGWLSIKPEDPINAVNIRTFRLLEPFPYNPQQTAYYGELKG